MGPEGGDAGGNIVCVGTPEECFLYDEDGFIYLAKQFRYPYKEEVLELPAGKLEGKEDPLQKKLNMILYR